MTRPRTIAFTLLELVLVLVIIGLALAVVTPSLGGWSRGMRMRNAADEVIAATRWARERAIAAAVPHSVTVDSDSNLRVAARDGAMVLDDGPVERTFSMPEGVTVRVEAEGDEVWFFPDGRSASAVFRITTDRGDVMEVASGSPAAGYAIMQTTGALR